MKRIAAPLVFLAIVTITFLVGLWTQAMWLIMPAFCLWTPCVFWFGFASAKAGIRIAVEADDSAATDKAHRMKQRSGSAYQ
jgi:hypothetical protein